MKEEEMNRLKDEELSQVTGGDMEITFNTIMQLIEANNDYMAREYFNLIQYSLAPLEAYTIRMTFWNKFGYPIDMYGG